MPRAKKLSVIAETDYFRLVRRGGWEFVQRRHATGVVNIIALTDEQKVVLVEQFRPPVERRVIEFPAGLVGDEPQFADEPLQDAARRELLEETGFQAERFEPIFVGASSAGLTDETVTFFRASGLTKVTRGGGSVGEQITVHEVPLEKVDGWLRQKMKRGCLVGARVYAGLYFLRFGD
jgi:ADP-ribose pyrophosphatase